MMHLDINPSTRWWEAQITAYRFQLENERSERRKLMAIEIKGLRSDALLARANIDRVRAAYARFNQAAPAHADDAAYDAFNAKAGNHVSDVEGLAEQLGGMAEDLTFATTTLGNSVAGSNAGAAEKPKEQPGEKQVITAAEVGKIDAESIVGQPTATTDRVALAPHPNQPEVEQAGIATFRAAE